MERIARLPEGFMYLCPKCKLWSTNNQCGMCYGRMTSKDIRPYGDNNATFKFIGVKEVQ